MEYNGPESIIEPLTLHCVRHMTVKDATDRIDAYPIDQIGPEVHGLTKKEFIKQMIAGREILAQAAMDELSVDMKSETMQTLLQQNPAHTWYSLYMALGEFLGYGERASNS